MAGVSTSSYSFIQRLQNASPFAGGESQLPGGFEPFTVNGDRAAAHLPRLAQCR